MWQFDHPTIPWCDVNEWCACICESAKDTMFNRLLETMRLACTSLEVMAQTSQDLFRVVLLNARLMVKLSPLTHYEA